MLRIRLTPIGYTHSGEHRAEIRLHLVVPVKYVQAPGVLIEDHTSALGCGGLGAYRASAIGGHLPSCSDHPLRVGRLAE
jgi:hypothetical protein